MIDGSGILELMKEKMWSFSTTLWNQGPIPRKTLSFFGSLVALAALFYLLSFMKLVYHINNNFLLLIKSFYQFLNICCCCCWWRANKFSGGVWWGLAKIDLESLFLDTGGEYLYLLLLQMLIHFHCSVSLCSQYDKNGIEFGR